MRTLSAKEKFEGIFSRLYHAVVMGKTHLAIGKGLLEKFSNDPVIADHAEIFWNTTIKAHLDTAQLWAFKLFDTEKKAVTLLYLVELSADENVIFKPAQTHDAKSQLISASREEISKIQHQLRRIAAKRSRVLAHSDQTIVTDREKLDKETLVTFGDLESVLDTASRILNRISVTYDGAWSSHDLMNCDDYQQVIQHVVDAKHDFVDSYEDAFGHANPNFQRPKTPRSPRWWLHIKTEKAG